MSIVNKCLLIIWLWIWAYYEEREEKEFDNNKKKYKRMKAIFLMVQQELKKAITSCILTTPME